MNKEFKKNYHISRVREFIQSRKVFEFIDIINLYWQQDIYSYVLSVRGIIPDDDLVVILNLREILKNIPKPPMEIPLGIETFTGTHQLNIINKTTALGKYPINSGTIIIEITGENRKWQAFNLINDVDILPIKNSETEILPEKTLLALMNNIELLDIVIEISKGSGIPYYPLFYSTTDEFLYESFSDLLSEFN